MKMIKLIDAVKIINDKILYFSNELISVEELKNKYSTSGFDEIIQNYQILISQFNEIKEKIIKMNSY